MLNIVVNTIYSFGIGKEQLYLLKTDVAILLVARWTDTYVNNTCCMKSTFTFVI